MFITSIISHAGLAKAGEPFINMCTLHDIRALPLITTEHNLPSKVQQLAWAVQVFAAEMTEPRDRPRERPKGAFGQEYPQARSSAASSPAVAGPLKVCPGLQAALHASCLLILSILHGAEQGAQALQGLHQLLQVQCISGLFLI